jgi:hypothetical protein
VKCIHCQSDTKGAVRRSNGGRCGACLHAFAFEPTTDRYRITDGAFFKLIETLSAKDTLSFTDRQLWYEMNRWIIARQKGGCAGIGISVLLLATAAGAGALHHGGLATGIALAAIGALSLATVAPLTSKRKGGPRTVVVAFDDFQSRYLGRWQEVHGPIARLVSAPRAPKAGVLAATATAAPDLTAYSFDRALVCESADIAAMLVANRFHFENNCAILSADRRYPAGPLFDTVMAMLRRNPSLLVLTAHDASPAGTLVPSTLRRADWFPEPGTRIADLGIRPRHAVDADLIVDRHQPAPLPDNVAALLPPEEAAWLAQGYRGELAAQRPAKLMKSLYQGFVRVAQAEADAYYGDDGIWYVGYGYGPGYWMYDPAPGTGYWGGDLGPSGEYGGSDSFG